MRVAERPQGGLAPLAVTLRPPFRRRSSQVAEEQTTDQTTMPWTRNRARPQTGPWHNDPNQSLAKNCSCLNNPFFGQTFQRCIAHLQRRLCASRRKIWLAHQSVDVRRTRTSGYFQRVQLHRPSRQLDVESVAARVTPGLLARPFVTYAPPLRQPPGRGHPGAAVLTDGTETRREALGLMLL